MPNNNNTIKIVSIADAAAYHQVSEKAIYEAIRKGLFQHVNGIPENQLDNYRPHRAQQELGRRPKSK